MYKNIIIILLFISVDLHAQQDSLTYQSVDSLSNQYYLKGDLDNLIKIGKEAIKQNIDYKILRQRIGYAWFTKGDYYAAMKQYEKALSFDESDLDTRAYLYYCGLNIGDDMYARYHAGKFTKELQQQFERNSFCIVNAVDMEYNYKSNDSPTRSNTNYMRLGVSTQLHYRLSLYQSVSDYRQIVADNLIKQPDYYASLNWSLSAHTSVILAYHYLNTKVDTSLYPAHMFFGAVNTKINRFHFGINGSLLKNKLDTCIQIGLQAGVTLPGKANIYLNSTLIGMLEVGNNRIVFSQTAGGHIYKKLWGEGSVTLGNLNNYHEYNGLYIYNALDPNTFRTGLSLFYVLSKNFTALFNYTYDIKHIDLKDINYNQHSFSGGIIWKL
jgi:tetratricopeptide (TPR) repeat protein